MEKLDNKVIIYDDVCPMCKAYTAGFMRLGWLENRVGFADAPEKMLRQVDLDRARHEIPLLDTRTGEVIYGVDALFLILGGQMPFLKPLFRSRLFRGAVFQLYQIITYNRRIIAGSRAPETGFDCAPDVNLFYRGLYIGLATVAATCLFLTDADSPAWASAALPGLFVTMLPGAFFTRKKLDFAGHWSTIFLVTALITSILPGILPVKAGAAALAVAMSWKRWRLIRSQESVRQGAPSSR